MHIKTVGSICSGIEAASVAWKNLGWKFSWFSEISSFPSKLLAEKYPNVENLGDMNEIPEKIMSESIECPDLICGGTPCQAFSLAGLKNGLNDNRGNLTLKFVDIINANDVQREKNGREATIVFWENVEGVLTDKTNAFGCLLSSLAGMENIIHVEKWPGCGVIHGPKRNVAWRVLDAKFFGIPQQRRRLYVLAGGEKFFPESILFEKHGNTFRKYPASPLTFEKDGHSFEIFREYTDCLYSSYGTKWNGNAAANNGSLFVVQDGRLRRLSPLECERLMGFPDDYTKISCKNVKKTNRYQGIGNSWAVPVVKWIGNRLVENAGDVPPLTEEKIGLSVEVLSFKEGKFYADFGMGTVTLFDGTELNCSSIPEICFFGEMRDVVSCNADQELYISPVGCQGMIRRKTERKCRMNLRLEEILRKTASTMSSEEIENKSRVQKRGRFSSGDHLKTQVVCNT